MKVKVLLRRKRRSSEFIHLRNLAAPPAEAGRDRKTDFMISSRNLLTAQYWREKVALKLTKVAKMALETPHRQHSISQKCISLSSGVQAEEEGR